MDGRMIRAASGGKLRGKIAQPIWIFLSKSSGNNWGLQITKKLCSMLQPGGMIPTIMRKITVLVQNWILKR